MNLVIDLKRDIKEIIDMMGFNLLHSPEATKEDERILVTIFVDEPKVLIGERGVNLNSLQAIFRMIASKKYGPDVRVDLDINGYKKRRTGFLKEMAFSVRNRVLREEKSVELEPMNSFDRRIIHSALSDFDDVGTESTGEHPYRRVVVGIIKS